MVKLLQTLKWSPDGCHVETISAGEHQELPPRAVEIALQLGILDQSGVGQKNIEQPEQPEQPGKKAKK